MSSAVDLGITAKPHEPTAAPLDRLRSAAARCRADGDADLAWLGEQIEAALTGDVSLAEALGLQYAVRLGARDAKLRELHRRYFPEKGAYAAAAEIDRLARRLNRSAAQISLDDPRRLIRDALETGVPFPKKSRLFSILSTQ
jgi:hypothetical protein